MNSTSNGRSFVGWADAPNERGTWDIILSCVSTIILCCWTAVCPNIPAYADGKWSHIRDKFDMACIGLLGPEFLLSIASGQLSSAKRSVKKMKSLVAPTTDPQNQWSLRHAFFADMGGFMIQDPSLPHPIPLTAKQMAHLIELGAIDYPQISKDDIDDRNKADGIVRIFSLGQASWFFVSTIARWVHRLPITTFELTTISFILVSYATSYCWYHKPADVYRSILLPTRMSVKDITAEWEKTQGVQIQDDPRDPLYFLKEELFLLDGVWCFYVNILHTIRFPLFSRPIKAVPHDRIRSCHMPLLDKEQEAFAGVFIIAFSATFMIAWNYHFPSLVEKILWRSASIYSMVFCCVAGGYCWIWYNGWLKPVRIRLVRRKESENQNQDEEAAPDTPGPKLRRTIRIPICNGQTTEVSRWFLVPITGFCALYCIFRLYILAEDIVGLRNVPSSVYKTLEWTEYFPHL